MSVPNDNVLRVLLPKVPDRLVSVKFYGSDVQINVHEIFSRGRPPVQKSKGSVCSGVFTKTQQKGLYRALSRIEHEAATWITLTWPNEYPGDYNICQKQLRSLLVAMRREGFTKFVGGWEFQQRGAPHVNLVTPYYIPHLFLKEHWFNIVGSDQQAHFHQGVHLIDIRSSKGQKFKWYIAGYIGKESQKVAPPGFTNMRRWGFWSRDYAGPSSQINEAVTFEQLDAFLGAVVDEKNAVLSALNEAKGRDYHLADKGRKGLSFRDGKEKVEEILKGVKVCKLPLILRSNPL